MDWGLCFTIQSASRPGPSAKPDLQIGLDQIPIVGQVIETNPNQQDPTRQVDPAVMPGESAYDPILSGAREQGEQQ
ncbi:MAG: hypothetical protein MUO62_01155 [Anaerolineales bacterium]|nr:hypothetical protein [Anaerolineales bacterium]